MTSSHLIIGGDSMIGKALTAALPDAYATIHRSKTYPQENIGCQTPLDLSTGGVGWPTLPKVDVAYICAGVTKLDMCEKNPQSSRAVNVVGTQILIEKLQAQGTHVVFLSSNQVFDGSVPFRQPSDATCPINAYGHQKAEVEAWLAARPHPFTILRLTKVVDGELPIIAEWKQKLQAGEVIEAFEDLVISAVQLTEVVNTLVTIGKTKPQGIIQLSGDEELSYYDMACALARNMGMESSLIQRSSAQKRGINRLFLPLHASLKKTAIHMQLV